MRARAIALPHSVTVAHRELIIEQATGHRMPTIFAIAADVSAGALVTYGVNRVALTLRAPEYVDRILRGVLTEYSIRAGARGEIR